PPPVTARFATPAPKSGPPPEEVVPAGDEAAGAEWLQHQAKLDAQRARQGRIRVPTEEEVRRRLGDSHPAAWQTGIRWSRVCYGYQPELTDAWFACSGAFRQEAPLGRVFQNAIFWVVTESLQCFY
ncbi:MAG TPA: hypothetical protein VIL46_10960, partial [Gemmataceae bacterium]